jgi:hypothetical protein
MWRSRKAAAGDLLIEPAFAEARECGRREPGALSDIRSTPRGWPHAPEKSRAAMNAIRKTMRYLRQQRSSGQESVFNSATVKSGSGRTV